MARPRPTPSTPEHRPMASSSSSPVLLHAAWTTAVVAVCLALCTIHVRKPSSSSSRRSGSSRPCASTRESNGAGGGGTPAKVSPTPSDTPKANGGAEPLASTAAGARGTTTDFAAGGGGPVTVIDVGTHGPIAPVFPAPDPVPPRRSLSAKHIRLAAERLGRIRSMRRGSGESAAAAAGEDGTDAFSGLRGGAPAADDDGGTLWTKTIILGERCRVPSGGGGEGEDDGGGDRDGDVMVPWRSYRPRQPRSVPVTRSNSFAGVGSHSAACRRADARC